MKRYFRLMRGYDPQKGGLNDLNELLNEFGIKFEVAHDTLYIEANEEYLEKYRKTSNNVGRPRKEFDFEYVEEQKKIGKTNKEIYESLGISKALFYRNMKERESMMEKNVDQRSYLMEQYKIAINDFKLAINEDEQWKARKELAKLEQTAVEMYGNAFCDELEKLKNEIK